MQSYTTRATCNESMQKHKFGRYTRHKFVGLYGGVIEPPIELATLRFLCSCMMVMCRVIAWFKKLQFLVLAMVVVVDAMDCFEGI